MTAGIDSAGGVRQGRLRGGPAAAGPRRALRVFIIGFGLVTAAACNPGDPTLGPGLEPPWEDQQRSGSPTTNLPPSFGNSATPGASVSPPPVLAGDVAGMGAPPTNPNTPAPTMMGSMSGAAGAGGQAPSEPMLPTSPADGGLTPPPNELGHDFQPECADEMALPLTAEGVCSFPLPDGVAVAPELAQIALVSNGSFSTVERVAGPLGCDLLNGGFYFDTAEPPTRITLCTQSCLRAGAAAEMQVVLVLGCAPSAP
jgi:hypothetical protein